jgi:hypothetical protein
MNLFLRVIRDYMWNFYNKFENSNNSNIIINDESNFFLISKYNGKGFLMFDIGANIGNYSEMILINAVKHNVVVQNYLFEPVRSSYEMLIGNYKKLSKWYINNIALSDKEAKIYIYFDNKRSG